MQEIELVSYIPQTGSFKVYYPKHFIIEETEGNIVTITSPETYSNITLTGYQASLNVDEKVLCDFFQQFTEHYDSISEMDKEISSKRIFLEQRFVKDNINWVWWAIAEENQIILISANTDDPLTFADYNLYKYMIDLMEIYPSSFE